ncbi:hypothetical protein V502_06784 [Pseudogymnoascus sp. VKM F-4520 (FW-2644)]|nr:hypothetical protein V502_06784 [Pseudogymnoascus sp. VKM F-4520 (FW-2644)]
MSDKDFAIEYVCAKRMHQSFTIPGTETRKPLKVTYAVAGLENDDAPTVVFISGMYGMRWVALSWHHIALRVGVRLVCVDRPSFGGSTPVPLAERIDTWLLTLPALVAHLKCKHIVPLAASAGTVYLLNCLYHLPSLLPPTPYAAILTPWVHPRDSGAGIMSFVASDWMPKFLVANHWDALSGFVATKLLPGFAASGGVMEGIAALGGSLSNPMGARGGEGRSEDEVADDARAMEAFGMTRARRNEVARLGLKLMFTEETSGANDEALLCAQKGPPAEVSWGICNDYRTFVPALAEMWEERLGGVAKLRVQAVFAEEDAMIGEGGRKFFEDCWKSRSGNGIEFTSSVAGGTTHDSIGDPEKGFLEVVLREAKRALEGAEERG